MCTTGLNYTFERSDNVSLVNWHERDKDTGGHSEITFLRIDADSASLRYDVQSWHKYIVVCGTANSTRREKLSSYFVAKIPTPVFHENGSKL